MTTARFLALLAVLAVPPIDARAQVATEYLTLPALPLMRTWADAVIRHQPGVMDSASFVPLSWSRDEMRHAWVYCHALAAVLEGRSLTKGIEVVLGGVGTRVRFAQADVMALADIATSIQKTHTANDFMKRAALLHTDTARLGIGQAGDPVSDTSMLTRRRLILEAEDGRQRGVKSGAVHWEFARVLLGFVKAAASDPFVRDWYRATLKYKLSLTDLDTSHFEEALKLFPGDADIRFLVGCLHETFADPRVQAARDNAMQLRGGLRLAFAGADEELARAQSFFRSALEADAAHVEARLRLGWTLHRRSRSKEAVEELRRAHAAASEPVLRYYGDLFLGAALEALGQMEEATRAYEHALTLFPAAQAPRLALSQLAHRAGEREHAERHLRDVLVPADDRAELSDPWWTYVTAAGRHHADAFAALDRQLAGSR